METALVTGAAGFIGSNLAEALLDRGYRVRGIDTLETGSRRNLASFASSDAFEFREVDVRDADAVASAVAGVDVVFHQAALASVPESVANPVHTTDVNCTGTATVLDAARRADVDALVVASSSAVYGSGGELPKREGMPVDPASPYALSKYYTEQLALEASELYGLETVALRYFNVYGPRQDPAGEYAAVVPSFIELLLDERRPTIFGDGEQTRDFVHVDDAVAANVRAAERDVTGEVVNVAGGRRVSINELAATLTDLLDSTLVPTHDDPRPGDVRHSYADITKAERLLDFEPSVDLETGLEDTIDHYR